MLGRYINGNSIVTILQNGRKRRDTIDPNDTKFIVDFPESCDMKITNYCDMGCLMCHENSSMEGEHSSILLTSPIIDNLHPYTELAIGGGNPLSHPDLIPFLEKLKEKKVIANITLNYKHFKDNMALINQLVNDKLIYGIGISSNKIDDELIEILENYPNVVLHVINGIITSSEIEKLYGKKVKILILGYKEFRRGKALYEKESKQIENNKKWMAENIKTVINNLYITSFDNLALEQIDARSVIGEDRWNKFYFGTDGTSTMFVDMVKNQFALNSTSEDRFDLSTYTNLDDAFKVIQVK